MYDLQYVINRGLRSQHSSHNLSLSNTVERSINAYPAQRRVTADSFILWRYTAGNQSTKVTEVYSNVHCTLQQAVRPVKAVAEAVC
jgi:hypothetical protein